MGVSSQYVASSASIADGAVSEVKLAAEACSVAKMKKEGTATHVLTSNGAGSAPSYQAAGISGSWAFVSEGTLSSNTLTFSGLSGQYIYQLICKGFTASDNVVLMQINGDTTDTHYHMQQQTASNTTLGGNRINSSRLFDAPSSTTTSNGITYLWRETTNGTAVAVTHALQTGGSIETRINTWNKSDAVVAEITSITIKGANTCAGKVSLFKASLV